MSNSPQLSPPGSSTYSSDSMYVGDGTWDSSRNTFLLPNLQGLNLATTQYNGMGNRFRNFAGYHSLIRAHGVIAAITFLGIVPAAIMIARFYHRNPRLALRMHIWLQILTVGLTTVVFTLGWFAVGPSRSLTNPHHGIGLAIYVLVLFQAIAGGLIHHAEKGKEWHRVPLKLVIHQWLGRAIALLGIAQVPLGLTLYGSPKALFIVYALWMFALLLLYFILSYRYDNVDIYELVSYISGSRADVREERHHHHRALKRLAAAGAAGAGLAALRRRSRSRRREGEENRTEVLSSRHSSRHGSVVEEKLTEDGRDRRDHTWRNRLLGATAGAGAFAGLKSLLDRRRGRDGESDVGSYSHPLGGPHPISQTDISRVEEGRAPESPANDRWRRTGAVPAAITSSPSRPHARHRRSGGSITSSSEEEIDEDRHSGHGLRDGIAALGVAGYARHLLNKRRDRREQRHVEEMRKREKEQDRLARLNSQRQKRYTGDGSPNRFPRRNGRRASMAESTAITGSNPELSRHTIPRLGATSIPTGPIPTLGSRANVVGATPPPATAIMPPAPPDPQGILHHQSSGSEAYFSAGGRQHRRHHLGRDVAAATAAAGAAAVAATGDHRRSNTSNETPPTPVSVKVKMHNDGRHVTLRRLNEQEAAAEREARRRERRKRNNHHRAGSLSSVGDDRWRRVEAMEAAQAEADRQAAAAAAGRPPVDTFAGPNTAIPATLPPPPPLPPGPSPSQAQPPPPPPIPAAPAAAASVAVPLPPPPPSHINIPPPPPIPAATTVAGSAFGGSPSSGPYATDTDASAFGENRRRRRAERAQAKLRGQQGGGGSGEGGGRVEWA